LNAVISGFSSLSSFFSSLINLSLSPFLVGLGSVVSSALLEARYYPSSSFIETF